MLIVLFVIVFTINSHANSLDEKEWLKIYYKESMDEYNYVYNTKERAKLKIYIYNYFLESSLKLWISNSKIKKNNFVLLTDSSIELRPANNIIFRAIINPETKSISEIMISIDKSSNIENFPLFYNLARIAIDMINIDITKYDVDDVYSKLSIEQIAIDRNYTAGLLKDGVDYSILHINNSAFFVLKKTQLEISSFFQETGKEKELSQNKDEFANNNEFFDTQNRDLSDRKDVAHANEIIENLQKNTEKNTVSQEETIKSEPKGPIISNESYKANKSAYPPYRLNKEGITEKKDTIESNPTESNIEEKKKESTVYWK